MASPTTSVAHGARVDVGAWPPSPWWWRGLPHHPGGAGAQKLGLSQAATSLSSRSVARSCDCGADDPVVASAAAWTRETSAATAARSALGHVDAVDAVGGVERAPGWMRRRSGRLARAKPARDAAQEKKKERKKKETRVRMTFPHLCLSLIRENK